MVRHLATHQNEANFLCLLCLKWFSQQGKAIRHRKMTHKLCDNVDLFRCHSCPYSTILKQNIQPHVLAHFGKSLARHRCPICDSVFRGAGELKSHLRTRSKENVQMRKLRTKIQTPTNDEEPQVSSTFRPTIDQIYMPLMRKGRYKQRCKLI